MRVINTIAELQSVLSPIKAKGQVIGFVPTMGALHAGHLSLIRIAGEQSDCVVMSIFVNPTQFNNPEDLKKYPRILDRDLELLSQERCDVVFVPDEGEMYPVPDTRVFRFGELESVMEGKFRPGHFNGVAQIVSKLFNAVQPHKAFFGLKDFQQLAIIRQMVKDLNYAVEIIACPIIREKDGLAMSSRNTLLTPENRKKAPLIGKTLIESRNFVPRKRVQEIADFVCNSISKGTDFDVEYFEIVDGHTLKEVSDWKDSDYIVGCIALYAGNVRLIDNIVYLERS